MNQPILEAHGKARTYVNSSAWKQTIEGVRIENGKLVDPRFVWRDIDPPDPE
ncbi:MAG: hypothetical protein HOH66_01920 [Rhodospirillaceae bacterium]|nr:hypothetical protein [Rhodospirillaceae bacterium]MBT6116609.1 hypothetical protein [Rhodospirillaceae bacterium]